MTTSELQLFRIVFLEFPSSKNFPAYIKHLMNKLGQTTYERELFMKQ